MYTFAPNSITECQHSKFLKSLLPGYIRARHVVFASLVGSALVVLFLRVSLYNYVGRITGKFLSNFFKVLTFFDKIVQNQRVL